MNKFIGIAIAIFFILFLLFYKFIIGNEDKILIGVGIIPIWSQYAAGIGMLLILGYYIKTTAVKNDLKERKKTNEITKQLASLGASKLALIFAIGAFKLVGLPLLIGYTPYILVLLSSLQPMQENMSQHQFHVTDIHVGNMVEHDFFLFFTRETTFVIGISSSIGSSYCNYNRKHLFKWSSLDRDRVIRAIYQEINSNFTLNIHQGAFFWKFLNNTECMSALGLE